MPRRGLPPQLFVGGRPWLPPPFDLPVLGLDQAAGPQERSAPVLTRLAERQLLLPPAFGLLEPSKHLPAVLRRPPPTPTPALMLVVQPPFITEPWLQLSVGLQRVFLVTVEEHLNHWYYLSGSWQVDSIFLASSSRVVPLSVPATLEPALFVARLGCRPTQRRHQGRKLPS